VAVQKERFPRQIAHSNGFSLLPIISSCIKSMTSSRYLIDDIDQREEDSGDARGSAAPGSGDDLCRAVAIRPAMTKGESRGQEAELRPEEEARQEEGR
jgi:hypothetical protein